MKHFYSLYNSQFILYAQAYYIVEREVWSVLVENETLMVCSKKNLL